MQGDERRPAARAIRMDDAGGERLAGAGGAGDEHGRVGGAGVGDFHKAALHGGRGTDELRE